MDSIFMSYRRAGTSGYGGRLHTDLRGHFGHTRVFRDVDSILPGTDFVKVIDEAVTRAGVVLALIGSNWLTMLDPDGNRRIDDPDDFVRLELEAAFRHGTVVIPVLVEHARMPSSTALPTSLIQLSRIQAIELSEERWEYDVGRLIARLEQVVGPPAPAFIAPYPAVARKQYPALTSDVLEARRGTTEVPDEPSSGDYRAPAQERQREPRRTWRATFGVIVSLIVLVAMGMGVAAIQPDRRVVPQVVDQDYDAAAASLRGEGFFVVAVDVVAEDKPAGAVFAQKPAGGTTATEGTTVILSIARTTKVTVPHIVERERGDAEAALREAGLTPEFQEETSDTVAADMVIRQSPASSAKVDKGATVTVVVSTGRRSSTQVNRVPTPTATPTTPTTRPSTTSTSTFPMLHGNDCLPPPGVTWVTRPC